MRRLLTGLAAASLVLAACGADDPEPAADEAPVSVSPTPEGRYAGGEFTTPRPRPSFTLTGTGGQPYDFAARTDGRATFLFFGYTHCPDICPTTMANVATALRDTPVQISSKVEVVFVTTDPARDTPQVLATWLRHFDVGLANPFVGLTGTVEQVRAAQQAAGVPVAEDNGQTHSTQVLLYGPDDLARVFYLDGTAPADMSHDLPLIMEE